MAVAWVFVLVGLAVIVWNRQLANAVVALDRTIADVLRLPVLRRRAHMPWRPTYTRFALIFAGLMWAGIGVLILILGLFLRVGAVAI
jgi:hypothetical protein